MNNTQVNNFPPSFTDGLPELPNAETLKETADRINQKKYDDGITKITSDILSAVNKGHYSIFVPSLSNEIKDYLIEKGFTIYAGQMGDQGSDTISWK